MTKTNYQKFAANSFLLRLSFLGSLPAAFFAGLKVKEITDEKVITVVKYSWFTKNPFRSIYFACLAMAAELSTGLLLINLTTGSIHPGVTSTSEFSSTQYSQSIFFNAWLYPSANP